MTPIPTFKDFGHFLPRVAPLAVRDEEEYDQVYPEHLWFQLDQGDLYVRKPGWESGFLNGLITGVIIAERHHNGETVHVVRCADGDIKFNLCAILPGEEDEEVVASGPLPDMWLELFGLAAGESSSGKQALAKERRRLDDAVEAARDPDVFQILPEYWPNVEDPTAMHGKWLRKVLSTEDLLFVEPVLTCCPTVDRIEAVDPVTLQFHGDIHRPLRRQVWEVSSYPLDQDREIADVTHSPSKALSVFLRQNAEGNITGHSRMTMMDMALKLERLKGRQESLDEVILALRSTPETVTS